MSSENISVNSFKIICRLCGEESSELIKLHLRKNRQRSLKESVKKYLGIKITPGDGLPDQICGPCIAKLDETKDFIEKCLNMQNQLQIISEACIVPSQSMQVDIKSEPFEDSALLMENLVTSILGEEEPIEEAVNSISYNTKPDEQFTESEQVTNEKREQVDAITKTFNEDSADFFGMSNSENESLRNGQNDIQKESSSSDKNPEDATPKRGRRKRAPHKCGECNKCYALKNSLRSHIKRIHHASMEKCPKCSKVLRSQYLWKTHMLTHTLEKPFHCEQCNKSYSSSIKLRIHTDTHIPIEQRYKYDCDVCCKKFTSKNGIKTHMKQHTGGTPFICDQCGKSYQTKSNLQIHYRAHTGEKPYKCQVCGKRYAHVKPFKIHERTHTGTRPYVCQHCTKTFSSPWVLKRHVLIHTDVRPYSCQFCAKDFRDQWKRKVHERIHTGERPYQCPFCQSAFYESGNLQKHCKNVHNQDYRMPFQTKEDPTDKDDFPSLHEGEVEESHVPNPLLEHTIFSNMELLKTDQLTL